jgi:hypothetical protein
VFQICRALIVAATAEHAITPNTGRSQERARDLGCTDEFRADPSSMSLDIPNEIVMRLPSEVVAR